MTSLSAFTLLASSRYDPAAMGSAFASLQLFQDRAGSFSGDGGCGDDDDVASADEVLFRSDRNLLCLADGDLYTTPGFLPSSFPPSFFFQSCSFH